MFDNLSLFISKQNYILFIHLKEYFKYVHNNYRSMRDLIQNAENYKNNFVKLYKTIKTKKEELYRKPENISKWELDPKENINKVEIIKNKDLALKKMLYKDTNNANNYKQLYGLFLNRILIESERMKNINSERHMKETLQILEKETDLITDFITCIADNNMALTKGQKKERKEREMNYEEKLDLENQKKKSHSNDNQDD